MKKIFKLFFIAFCTLALFGCAKNQGALLDYINKDVQELGKLETQMITSYNSVMGENYVSDYVSYSELSTNTIKYAQELNSKALELADKYTSNSEIMELHKIYIKYAQSYLNAISYIMTGCQLSNQESVIQGNKEMAEANTYGLDFKTKLNELCKKNNVVLKN